MVKQSRFPLPAADEGSAGALILHHLLRCCRLNRTQAADSYDTVSVGLYHRRLFSLFPEHIQRMMGSSDQILPFADREMILHPFAESLIIHSVYVFSLVIRCSIRGDQLILLTGTAASSSRSLPFSPSRKDLWAH
jgi:hypothetical protein